MNIFQTSLACLVVLAASAAFAEPKEHKLIKPDSVKLNKDKQLVISYTLPCEADDVVTFVGTFDDTGDLVTTVGVVYASDERSCVPVKPKKFKRTINPGEVGVKELEDAEFKPMDVAR